jgi:hypothetical protein
MLLKGVAQIGMTQNRADRRRARQRRRRSVAAALAIAVLTLVGVASAGVLSSNTHQHSSQTVVNPSHHSATTAAPVGASVEPGLTAYPTADGMAAPWVKAENARPGTSAWQITTPQSAQGIMGYANMVQAQVGQTVTIYVSTEAPTFQVYAYRMGYYQGLGAREVWSSGPVTGRVNPPCGVAAGINMVACKWPAALSFTVTSSWVQGQYLLKLVGSGGQESYIPLTVWDPASHATYVIMAGVLTDQAFNAFGGYDLYQGATPCAAGVYPCSSRARVVSFDRPYAEGDGASSYLSEIYPLTRLAEMKGLDVTYWTDIILSTNGNLLGNHKVLISTNHDEEWSRQMRQAATAATAKGVNLIFLGASPILRKVRLQSSPLGPDREMVNYRDPSADPLYGVDNADVSQNWWGQAPASLADSLLVGADYVGYDDNSHFFPLVVSDPSSWLFAGTGLGPGASIPGVFAGDFQAYDPALGGTPPNVEILAHSPVTIIGHPDRHYADTTYYTMPASHAGVFSSGGGWTTPLQQCSPATSNCPLRIMQAIIGNLLRVFGAGPVGLTYPSVSNVAKFYG